MKLINREDIKYTDLFLNEKTGLAIKTVAKVQIDNMPVYTIDDLRPHGKWIVQDSTYTKFQCSACKSKNHNIQWPFCCKCGAKMDKE